MCRNSKTTHIISKLLWQEDTHIYLKVCAHAVIRMWARRSFLWATSRSFCNPHHLQIALTLHHHSSPQTVRDRYYLFSTTILSQTIYRWLAIWLLPTTLCQKNFEMVEIEGGGLLGQHRTHRADEIKRNYMANFVLMGLRAEVYRYMSIVVIVINGFWHIFVAQSGMVHCGWSLFCCCVLRLLVNWRL